MHAQALSLLEGLAAFFALIVSCISVDLAIENTTAIFNNNKKQMKGKEMQKMLLLLLS